jgi:hypothetical protein
MASDCTAIVVVKAIFNRLDLIRGEVVAWLYLKRHIVRPRLQSYRLGS